VISWAPVIPLVGGFPIAAESVFSNPPVGIYSYKEFAENDRHYSNYKETTITLMSDAEKQHIDCIVITPPCAGLSRLNTKDCGSSDTNEWIIKSSVDAINKFTPNVIIGENAPALFTTAGEHIFNELRDNLNKHGYTVSLYRTSTHLHGIPQKRIRTFFFAWKTKLTPELPFIERECKSVKDYISEMPPSEFNNVICNKVIMSDMFFKFISSIDDNPRSFVSKNSGSSLKAIKNTGNLDNFYKWFNIVKCDMRGEDIERVAHMKSQFDKGLNIWDSSIKFNDDYVPAIISRNCKDLIHPLEDRSYTIRELMYFMGLGENYRLLTNSRTILSQNVPVCTARDMVTIAKNVLEGNVPLIDSSFTKIDNIKRTRFTEQLDW